MRVFLRTHVGKYDDMRFGAVHCDVGFLFADVYALDAVTFHIVSCALILFCENVKKGFCHWRARNLTNLIAHFHCLSAKNIFADVKQTHMTAN